MIACPARQGRHAGAEALDGLETDGGPGDAAILPAKATFSYLRGDLETAARLVEQARPLALVGSSAESTTSLAVPTVADYHDRVRAWMTGHAVVVPAYLPIPGTEQLPSEAATVIDTGGCG